MAKKGKAKAVKKSKSKSSAAEPEMPNLAAVMMKIAERLESLEKKMDAMMSSGQPRFQQNQAPQPRHAQNFQPRRPQQNPHAHPHQPKQNHNFQQPQQKPARALFKAVCADCQKDCEVPFQPTGERPTYCKECFAARKSGGNFRKEPNFNRAPSSQGHVKVIPNGAGKITIRDPFAANKTVKPKPKKFAKKR